MASTPATKRRRLDTASATLSKPFVSPFKTPLKCPPIQNDKSTTTAGRTPSERPPTATPSNPTATSTSTAFAQHKPTPKPNRTPPTLTTTTTTDPTLLPLLQTHRALSTRLRALHTEIDTLAQAAKIESSDSDAELVALIAKWKGASREAAEEVFGDVRDRVNRMGGVGAWREREGGRRRRGGGWGFDEGNGHGHGHGQGEEGEGEVSEGERERRRAEVEDLVDGDGTEERRGEGGGVVEEEDGADDDTFTMDMMLRSLNIDLDVIGFDKESQRWID